eukprot:GHVU01021879.1.p1 GENE.GHVU01021879.1~~GHVU01021879.1.p1  ORF type:complete len:192 (-),score=29.26 GHVU01021879.1:659-1234(-)
MDPAAGNKDQKRHPEEHEYPDVFHPSAPHPFYHINPLFKDGLLKDSEGGDVPWSELRGKSVALYFADNDNLKCRNFFPHLLQYYKVLNESGSNQKIEIIFVPLDESPEKAEEHRKRQPWLSLPFGDPLIDYLKQHFRAMGARELPKYAYGPRSAPPCLLIVGRDGRLLLHLNAEELKEKSLKRWDFVAKRF